MDTYNPISEEMADSKNDQLTLNNSIGVDHKLDKACSFFYTIIPSSRQEIYEFLIRFSLKEHGCNLIKGLNDFHEQDKKYDLNYSGEITQDLGIKILNSLISDIRRLPYVWTACQDFHLDLIRRGTLRILDSKFENMDWEFFTLYLWELLNNLEEACSDAAINWSSISLFVKDIHNCRKNIFEVTSSRLHKFHKRLKKIPEAKRKNITPFFFELFELLSAIPINNLEHLIYNHKIYIGEVIRQENTNEVDWPPKNFRTHLCGLHVLSSLILEGSYLRTAPKLALNLGEDHIDYLDKIQEALIGVMYGARRFDYRCDERALSPCSTWAWQRVTRFEAETGKTVRVPNYIQEQNATDLGLRLTNSSMPFDRSRFEVQNADGYCYFLDDDMTLEDYTISNMAALFLDVERSCTHIVLKDILLENLSDIEYDIVSSRYGFDGQGVHTLENIGSKYSRTRERIRQIEFKALKKLERCLLHSKCEFQIDWYDYSSIEDVYCSPWAKQHIYKSLYSETLSLKPENFDGTLFLVKKIVDSLPTWRGLGSRRGKISRKEQLRVVLERLQKPTNYVEICEVMRKYFPDDTPKPQILYTCLAQNSETFSFYGNGFFALRTDNSSNIKNDLLIKNDNSLLLNEAGGIDKVDLDFL